MDDVSFDKAVELSFLNGWHEALRRAADIIDLAREGEIDSDLRAIKFRIQNIVPEGRDNG